MTYIKKLVMQGFKSFARRTEIPLENAMNVIVGPNGSGKSNITDALCFVLGRMGTKSIRAAKSANLLFSGNKQFRGSNEAVVEVVFDNTDGLFSIDKSEISIKRIVRKNGLSVYKINNETKTRQELIELLAQAGVDPNGFNIVLQGEIASMIKSSPEERRKIIEEVAGISIYETRKEKSLKELEKTEEKLKETGAVLREKTNYMKNLEKDRQDALNYQRIEISIKQCKAGILFREIKEREKEIEELEKQRGINNQKLDRLKENAGNLKIEILSCEAKIREITNQVEQATSGEQDQLHGEISDLKADLAGLFVRKENFEGRTSQNSSRIEGLRTKIKQIEQEIDSMLKKSPEIKKQKEFQKEIEVRISELEKQRRAYYNLKSELSTLESRKEEKQKICVQSEKELEIINRTVSQIFNELRYAKSSEKAEQIKNETLQVISQLNSKTEETEAVILQIEKKNAVLEQTIERETKLTQEIGKMEECPLCKNKITEQHRANVLNIANDKIEISSKILKGNFSKKTELESNLSGMRKQVCENETKLNEISLEILKIRSCEEKKERIKKLAEEQKESQQLIKKIEDRIFFLHKEFDSLKNVEEKYEEAVLSLKEVSLLDNGLEGDGPMKQRDIERMRMEIKSLERDSDESSRELAKILERIAERKAVLAKKERQEQELYERFQKFYSERNEIQDKQKALETNVMGIQHEIKSEDEKNNVIKLREAELNAKLEALENDFQEFKEIEASQGTKENLANRLIGLQARIAQLGNINMRALEMYDQVKQVCDAIQEKVNIIEKEKEKINEIIQEIDKKKKKSFFKTLDTVNQLFTRNFTQVSRKGEVFLELENKENPFDGGLDVIVRVGRGKYFDVTSLSGGEKTLVALSLIFAIQEYKPYCFYVFDEIDAALDKHNSELLAGLIRRYMASGQYIIVTHNDALIETAPTLFGVSMQEGISKIVSQRL